MAGGRSPDNAFPSSDLLTAPPNSLEIQRIADRGQASTRAWPQGLHPLPEGLLSIPKGFLSPQRGWRKR